MKRIHSHAKNFFARNTQSPRAFGVLFIVAFLLLAASASGPSHSVEVGYSALSPLGLEGGQIVPASCGSANNSPLYGQACSASNSCGQSNSGTYDTCGNCTAVAPSDASCPTCASVGALGTYPNCYYAPITPPVCTPCNPALEAGVNSCSGCYPYTCSGVGATGTWPACTYPPPPPGITCSLSGSLGIYPNCYYMCPDNIHTTIWSDKHDCPSSSPPPPACTSTGVYCSTPPNSCGLYWAGTLDSCGVCSVGTTPRSEADCGSSPPSPPPSYPPPSISAVPSSVQQGSVSTITWSCPSPNSSASGVNFSTGGAASGSVQVTVSANTTYTVVCGQTGTQSSVSVSVLNSSLSLVAAPSRVQSGNTSTLTWSASNVTSCTLVGPGVSAQATAVSGTVSPRNTTTPGITGQSTYTLTCQTAGNPVSTSVQVNVIPTEQEI